MASGRMNHKDCFNFAPLDVAKGVCHRTKGIVLADAESCELCETAPRCKFCVHFRQGAEPYVGICEAAPLMPMTYPDLSGVTCQSFQFQRA